MNRNKEASMKRVGIMILLLMAAFHLGGCVVMVGTNSGISIDNDGTKPLIKRRS